MCQLWVHLGWGDWVGEGWSMCKQKMKSLPTWSLPCWLKLQSLKISDRRQTKQAKSPLRPGNIGDQSHAHVAPRQQQLQLQVNQGLSESACPQLRYSLPRNANGAQVAQSKQLVWTTKEREGQCFQLRHFSLFL